MFWALLSKLFAFTSKSNDACFSTNCEIHGAYLNIRQICCVSQQNKFAESKALLVETVFCICDAGAQKACPAFFETGKLT